MDQGIFPQIDYNVRYRKCYDLLKENGYLVLLWNVAPEINIPGIKKAYDLYEVVETDFYTTVYIARKK